MPDLSMKTTLDAPAHAVWEAISDFNGIPKYVAAVDSSTMEGEGVGALRTLTLQDGARILERLESLDDSSRTLSYSIVESPLPMEEYISTMRVRELGPDRCELQWSCTFEPTEAPESELRQIIEGIYDMGFEGLKQLLGA